MVYWINIQYICIMVKQSKRHIFMKTLLIILLSFFLLNCKKNEPKCFLVQEEWTTVYKPNSPNFYRYGDDNIDEKKISYIECNLFKID